MDLCFNQLLHVQLLLFDKMDVNLFTRIFNSASRPSLMPFLKEITLSSKGLYRISESDLNLQFRQRGISKSPNGRIIFDLLKLSQDDFLQSLNFYLGKGTCQKLLSGFCPLRGGDTPFPLSFFEHNDFPLRGGVYPPIPLRKKIR